MSLYAKLSLDLVISKASDYTRPVIKSMISAYESTPDEWLWLAPTAGTALEATVETQVIFDSVSQVILVNEGSVAVTAYYYTAADTVAGVNGIHVMQAGQFIVETDFDPDGDLLLQAASGTADCIVGILGS